jgi:SAM-dependent methyltransferase
MSGERRDRPAPPGDPATAERIWGARIAGIEGGYSDAYNAERRVDERLMATALDLARPPGLALDVGSFYPEMPKRLAGLGWSVVCVDLSEEVCRRVHAAGPPLRAVRCDAGALPFRPGAFDLVTDFATSVVTPNAGAVVAQEVGVLKPGGVYVLVSNNHWSRSGRRNLRRQRRAGGRHPRWGYFSPLSPWQLWRLARRHRLRLVRVDSEVHNPGSIGLVSSLLVRLVPGARRLLGWRLGAVFVGRR